MTKSIHTAEYAALRQSLRRIRKAAGISQRALAEILDVAPSWVAKVESGERRLDIVEYCWFVHACNCRPATTFAKWHQEFFGSAAKQRKKVR